MNWAEALPNLLIGLREGLEAGLVVSILLAAVRKAPTPTAGAATAVWFGVAAALSLSASFAAVLTFSTAQVSTAAQEVIGGALSVLAVGLVTGMIFWMRRSAGTLAPHLRGEVTRALSIGSGALAITGFLAVGREALETTLFIWTAVKASGTTVAPLVGASLGVAASIGLCVLLYRQAVRLNLSVFFNRTAIALVVIAAGVLAYGLGELQAAGVLPGHTWLAFDLSNRIDAGSWWMTLVTGVTELRPTMTVLQVTAWVGYLACVLWAFLRATREQTQSPNTPGETGQLPAVSRPISRPLAGVGRIAGQHRWAAGAALVVVPVLIAGGVIATLPEGTSAASTAVTINDQSCAPEWRTGTAGAVTFAVTNRTTQVGEFVLTNASGAILAEIETLGPGTTATMTTRLGGGTYQFRCNMSRGAINGPEVTLSGARATTATAILRVTPVDLTRPNNAYQRYAKARLRDLATDIARLRTALAGDDRADAERAWLAAQLDWERVGASYNSFGELGIAVDGLPDGLPKGTADPAFTGLHRIEHGLYHREPLAHLQPIAARLADDVSKIRTHLASDDLAGDPTNLPLRAHEILEDALRDHLAGLDDNGAHAAYAMTYADTQVTRVVLHELAALVDARNPGLVATLDRQLAVLDNALTQLRHRDSTWPPPAAASLAGRQRVTAALGAFLETVDQVPDLLEVAPTH